MHDVKYFPDSTTALCRIRGEPRNFRPFVPNRVAEVLTEIKPTQQHHMRTNLNTADIAPRGAQASDIRSESPWVKGPEFLKCDESE